MSDVRVVRLRDAQESLLLRWYDVYVGSALIGSIVAGGGQPYSIIYWLGEPVIEMNFMFLTDAIKYLVGPDIRWEFDGWEEC